MSLLRSLGDDYPSVTWIMDLSPLRMMRMLRIPVMLFCNQHPSDVSRCSAVQYSTCYSTGVHEMLCFGGVKTVVAYQKGVGDPSSLCTVMLQLVREFFDHATAETSRPPAAVYGTQPQHHTMKVRYVLEIQDEKYSTQPTASTAFAMHRRLIRFT